MIIDNVMLTLFCAFSERLSIAFITNRWAPVEETTGPRRVTNSLGGATCAALHDWLKQDAPERAGDLADASANSAKWMLPF